MDTGDSLHVRLVQARESRIGPREQRNHQGVSAVRHRGSVRRLADRVSGVRDEAAKREGQEACSGDAQRIVVVWRVCWTSELGLLRFFIEHKQIDYPSNTH